MMDENEQETRTKLKPNPSLEQVTAFVKLNWGLNVIPSSLRRIESYDDANFYCNANNMEAHVPILADTTSPTIKKYLIKFYNAVETTDPQILHGLSSMLAKINSSRAVGECVQVPTIIPPLTATESAITNAGIGNQSNENTAESNIEQRDYVFMDDCAVLDGGSERVAVRIFRWIPGTTLDRRAKAAAQAWVQAQRQEREREDGEASEAGAPPDFDLQSVMLDLGAAIGAVTVALRGFDHPAFRREHMWDLRNLEISVPLFGCVQRNDGSADEETQRLLKGVCAAFRRDVLPVAVQGLLPEAVIMGDCNDANVIVSESSEVDINSRASLIEKRERVEKDASVGCTVVTGLIDFSDAVRTWAVNELAIAMAYSVLTCSSYTATVASSSATIKRLSSDALLHAPQHGKDVPSTAPSSAAPAVLAPAADQERHRSCIVALGCLLAGYIFRRGPLSTAELRCLPVLVCTRLSISIAVGAYAISLAPHDDYLKLHALPARDALAFLCKSRRNRTCMSNGDRAGEVIQRQSQSQNGELKDMSLAMQEHLYFFNTVQEAMQREELITEVCAENPAENPEQPASSASPLQPTAHRNILRTVDQCYADVFVTGCVDWRID